MWNKGKLKHEQVNWFERDNMMLLMQEGIGFHEELWEWWFLDNRGLTHQHKINLAQEFVGRIIGHEQEQTVAGF